MRKGNSIGWDRGELVAMLREGLVSHVLEKEYGQLMAKLRAEAVERLDTLPEEVLRGVAATKVRHPQSDLIVILNTAEKEFWALVDKASGELERWHAGLLG